MSLRFWLLGLALLCSQSARSQQIVVNGVPIGASPTQNTTNVVNVPAGGDVVNAVAQVASAGGGTVNLAAGVYNITGSINLGSNVTINGQGRSTVIYAPKTPNGVAMMAAANGAVSNVIIENLVLDGNVPLGAFGQGGEYANSGIYLYGNNNAVSNVLVKNVEIRNTGIGILMTVVNSITFNNIYVHDNNPGNFAHNAYLVGCDFVYILHSRFIHAHTGDGLHFDFSASYYQISKSEFSNNHGEGILDQGGTQINIQDSQFNWNVNDGLNASSTGELLTRSVANYNGGDGYNIQGGEDSTDLVDIPHMGYDFFNYGAGAFSNLVGGTTPNRYLAILANGVTGAADTADWVTSLSGYQGGALSGYSSIGVVDFNVNHLANGLLTFPAVGAVGSGSYSTTWAYSNGTNSTLSMPLVLNGVSAGTINFPPTGSWSTWSTVNVTMNLKDGGNVVSVSPSPAGAPLLDYLQVNVPVPAVPAAPTGFAVSATSPYSTQLTWNVVPGAATYNIVRSGALIAVGVTGTNYTDNDILLGSSTYSYQVYAVNQGGGGPASASRTITTPIDAPAGLQVSATANNNVLSWLSSNGAASYNVLRSYIAGGPYTPIGSVTQTSYTDTTAAPEMTAYYVVEAVDAAGTASVSSYELGALTPLPPSSFLVTPAAASLTLQLNTGGTLGVSITDGSSFSGTVTFSDAGLPSGASSTFIPASSTTGTTLVLFVPATVLPGTYPITVTGTAGNVTSSKTFNLIIPHPQTITFNPIASQAEGTSLPLAVTSSAGLPVTVASSTPSVCTVTGSTANLVGAGTCTLVASQSGNATNSAAASVTQSFGVVVEGFTLNTATPVLTQQPNSSGTEATTLSRLNGFSGAVTYTVTGLPSGVSSSVSGSTVTVTVAASAAPGSYPVTVTGTSGAYTATSYFTLVIPAVVAGSQTITFDAITGGTAGTSLSLSGSASSGLPVTYAATTPSVCTVTGSAVHLLAAGICTLVASQAGDSSYAAAAPVTQSFVVAAQAFTLTASATKLTEPANTTLSVVLSVTPIDGFNSPVAYSISGLPNGVTSGMSGDILQLTLSETVAPGSYPLTVTGSSGSLSAQLPLMLNVTSSLAAVTVTAPTSGSHGGGGLDLWTLGGLATLAAVGSRRRRNSRPHIQVA